MTFSASIPQTTPLMIRIREAQEAFACAVCSAPAASERGAGIFTYPDNQPVCGKCGQKLNPLLWALCRLGQTAQEVGRVQKHCPHGAPLTLLLCWAQAAEKFAAHMELDQ